MWRESPCGALAVHQDVTLFAIDFVPFVFGDVVAHVVDDIGLRVVAENALQGAPQEVSNPLSISPSEICRSAHGGQIALSFR